jgi:hypothetical protein
MRVHVVVIGVVIFLVACTGSGPRSDDFNRWVKKGESPDEIKKALLECGAYNPFEASDWPGDGRTRKKWEIDYEHAAKVDLCMVNSGYQHKSENGGWCSVKKIQGIELEACKPENAYMAYKRAPANRLNSHYCRQFPHTEICQP